MKILFYGRGVINTQYAWALENAGHTVEFYVRKGRKAQYGTHIDMEILDMRRSKKDRLVKKKWPIVTHEDIPGNHDYDLIFVSVNPEQISDVVSHFAPRAGSATILFFGNFWDDIRKAADPIPLDQIVWGFPGCGGGIEGNSLYGGLYKTVHVGVFESEPSQRDLALHNLFTGAGFKVSVHTDFQNWLRNHFISNVAMEVEVLKHGSFINVASSQAALAGMAKNTRELISLLKAKDVKLDSMTRIMVSLPPGAVGFLMKNMVFKPGSVPYATMKHNHYKPGASVRQMITEARTHGIKVPRLMEVESLITE